MALRAGARPALPATAKGAWTWGRLGPREPRWSSPSRVSELFLPSSPAYLELPHLGAGWETEGQTVVTQPGESLPGAEGGSGGAVFRAGRRGGRRESPALRRGGPEVVQGCGRWWAGAGAGGWGSQSPGLRQGWLWSKTERVRPERPRWEGRTLAAALGSSEPLPRLDAGDRLSEGSGNGATGVCTCQHVEPGTSVVCPAEGAPWSLAVANVFSHETDRNGQPILGPVLDTPGRNERPRDPVHPTPRPRLWVSGSWGPNSVVPDSFCTVVGTPGPPTRPSILYSSRRA